MTKRIAAIIAAAIFSISAVAIANGPEMHFHGNPTASGDMFHHG